MPGSETESALLTRARAETIFALVADAAQYAPDAGGRYLLPEAHQDQLETGDPAVLNAALEEAMAQDRGLRFTLERGMLTHGFATPIEYLRGAMPYTLEGVADRIQCPTLICAGENDSRGGGGKPLYDAMGYVEADEPMMRFRL